MPLKLHKIADILGNGQNQSCLVSIVVDYTILKQKLKDSSNKSWYFKKGRESYEQKLASLENEYEKIRAVFNENTADFFLDKINERNRQIRQFSKEESLNTVVYLGRSMLRSNRDFHIELLRMKSRTDLLMPLSFYLQYPEVFLEITNYSSP
ncbi:hypothetical protein [Arenibacter lacus]|uniref:hypothetical protein n=1 Tax=Arenibacter lacus TaxID=2608629 RepID=UPI00123DE5CF|nr:hypothetical protein [Arenibacter lacus]